MLLKLVILVSFAVITVLKKIQGKDSVGSLQTPKRPDLKLWEAYRSNATMLSSVLLKTLNQNYLIFIMLYRVTNFRTEKIYSLSFGSTADWETTSQPSSMPSAMPSAAVASSTS